MAKEINHRFNSWQKAIDLAIWLTFKHRVENIPYGSIPSEGGYNVDVFDTEHDNLSDYYKGIYKQIPFSDIKAIRQDAEQLAHWESICGTFSIMDGELLRFILHTDLNLKKFIRYELASRGFDKNHQWCGFEKAEDIWLTK